MIADERAEPTLRYRFVSVVKQPEQVFALAEQLGVGGGSVTVNHHAITLGYRVGNLIPETFGVLFSL